ncbi:hypothetical protein WDW37_02785 [Bdellovibrionota bacterium FG-1]
MINASAAISNSCPHPPAPASIPDELIRIFNTALIATQTETSRDFSSEIYELMETAAFRAMLGAVRQHSRLQGLSEKQAAEQIIMTFRKMDRVWRDYVFQEGVEKLKNAT